MRQFMNPNRIFFLLHAFILFGCEKQRAPKINEQNLIGVWIREINPNIKFDGAHLESQIILSGTGAAKLTNVPSVICGEYDKIQTNNGNFSWRLSSSNNHQLIDITSNSINICLSLDIQDGETLSYKYDLGAGRDSGQIIFRKN